MWGCMRKQYILLISMCIAVILIAGCTSTSNTPSASSKGYSFAGEWHAVAARIQADMGLYYSIRNDGTWSFGGHNDDGTKDETSHGTYTVNGNTAHFTDLVFTDQPFNLTINDTGFINENIGAQGTAEYHDIVTYAKISNVAGAAAT